MSSDLWFTVWFLIGAQAAYALGFAAAFVAVRQGRPWHGTLQPLLRTSTVALACWFIGYVLLGPWWALLATPALLVALVLCVAVCAYVREGYARRRVLARERGR